LLAGKSWHKRFSLSANMNTIESRDMASKRAKGHGNMNKNMLQAKLHGVRVTETLLHYEGSCGIDEDLLDAAGLVPFQYIDIYNVTNGERFGTYIIACPRQSGSITLNGAAARKASLGDKLIICSYSSYTEIEAKRHVPIVLFVDKDNHLRRRLCADPKGSMTPEVQFEP